MKPEPEIRAMENLVKDGETDARSAGLLFAASALLALLTATICHFARAQAYPGESIVPDLLYGTALWLWWGAMAALMFRVARRWSLLFRFSALDMWGILGHMVAAALFAAAHLALMLQVLRFLSRHWTGWDITGYLFPLRFGLELLLYAFVFGIVGTHLARAQVRQEAMRRLELEKQLSQAQLKALQTQIEPHFLFNTLNALTALIETGRGREASEMLAHLNKILRSTLERKAPEKVPFAQELQVIESYLAIQQVRFADRLKVKIETTAEALEGMVPCFLLQPIVENAIRHGIAPLDGGGVLETSVERVGEILRMRVRDNGPGLNGSLNGNGPAENGYGIGMRNTRERLSFFYPGAYEFAAREPEGGGCEVTIQIPYERRAREA